MQGLYYCGVSIRFEGGYLVSIKLGIYIAIKVKHFKTLHPNPTWWNQNYGYLPLPPPPTLVHNYDENEKKNKAIYLEKTWICTLDITIGVYNKVKVTFFLKH